MSIVRTARRILSTGMLAAVCVTLSAAGGQGAVAVAAEHASCAKEVPYVVRNGDTMYGIAHRFGVSSRDVIEDNPQVENPEVLATGQKLQVKIPEGMCVSVHKVQPGETLGTIAKDEQVDRDALQLINGITEPSKLSPGDVLVMPN